MKSDRDKHAASGPALLRRLGQFLTEFSITFATSATFNVALESANLAPVIPLVFGGLVSARSPVVRFEVSNACLNF